MLRLLQRQQAVENPAFPSMDFTPSTRAWAALNFIELNPEEWNQKDWKRCLAGWVVRQSGVSEKSLGKMQIRETAMRLLEVNDRQANRLFSEGNSSRRLRRRVRRQFGKDPFPK